MLPRKVYQQPFVQQIDNLCFRELVPKGQPYRGYGLCQSMNHYDAHGGTPFLLGIYPSFRRKPELQEFDDAP